MTNSCPNALSLAVAIAISSSIMSTEALAVRKLETKSVYVPGSRGAEYTRSEVMVQPTLGDDQQPVPKSVTTTYPYEPSPSESPDYIPTIISLTDILYGIDDGVSSVDQFETDENDVAQKYTKVLKVGDEGVFRFTHKLEEKKLVIEVRGGMTDQDSVESARRQLVFSSSLLEPLTKIAGPMQLAELLEAASNRAGHLGKHDHYVALATIEVEKVAVNGRTFMRLIASGDHPPEPQRLGQSLFVNDEALLAAAASAYIQVHVLEEDLQQQALNELLAHNKPVGYVVHVEDDTQVYPVPAGYPKLEITEAPGEDIVFHGQMQNPNDVALVENLYKLWVTAEVNNPAPAVITWLLRYKIKNYELIIRSRQMSLLEEIVARHDAGIDKDRPTMLSDEDKLALRSLAYYESLHQALALATPDNPCEPSEFEFTLEHIRVASLVITPTRLHKQLAKYFSFKPVLRNLLMNRHFFQTIRKVIPVIGDIKPAQIDTGIDEEFTARVMTDMARQLLELSGNLEELRAKHARPGIRTEAETIAATKALVATIAARLSIEDFDDNTDIDDQQERLIQKLETMNAEAQSLRQQLKTMSIQLDREDIYTNIRKGVLAQVLGIDPNDNTALSDRAAVESAVYNKLIKLKFLDTYVDYIRTGHSEVMPEVLETLSDVEKALRIRAPDENDDVYLRRQSISEELQEFIAKARQRSEKKALDILKDIEEILDIKVNEEDDKTTRLIRVRRMFDGDDLTDHRLDKIDNTLWADENAALVGKDLKLARLLAHFHYKVGGPDPDKRDREQQTDPLAEVEETLNIAYGTRKDRAARLAMVLKIMNHNDAGEYLLGEIEQALWKEDSKTLDERGLRLRKLDASLTYKVEEPYHDQQVRKRQTRLIAAVEHQLNIHPLDYVAAVQKVKAFTAKLASDLMMNFDEGASLSDQKDALITRIQAFRDEVNEVYEDETARRARNNEIARQLNMEDYKDDATINDQNSRIKAKLQQLEEEVINKIQPDVNTRITVIENELDRHMTRLGPKPRYVLDREASIARQALEKAESELVTAYRKNREQPRLEAGIEARKADIERMKYVLKAAEQAVENDDGPFQYTPRQVKVLTDMHDFIYQHALKKQALEAAMGLAASAAKSGKLPPLLSTFDFDDEFAPIRLQAAVGKDLTFHQASRIARVFRNLKRSFPHPSSELVDDQPQSILEEVQILVQRVRNEMGKGALQYDEVINGMGKIAIHFVKYEEDDLKSFLEYLVTRSASGNKIIALLHEGLISKVELENYIKAVRGVDGYQTVAEFEHFLGYIHGVRVPEFRKVVQMLSDEGAEQFMRIAFAPVTVTATGPAGMKESVTGMKEFAAAIIANYVLDDIAFENGRRTAAFLANVQDTLAPYANAAGLSESDLIQAIHDTLMQVHAAAVERQLHDYWIKPSAFLVQAVTWYYSSYKPLLVTRTALEAAKTSLSNIAFLYLLDLTNRGDYTHRMLTPFQHWLERFGVDLDRTGQYAYHSRIEKISEVGGLAMPLGKAASSVILLRTGSMLFARQRHANPQMYRSIFRLVPEIVKSMGSGQGAQIPLLHRITPEKVKTLASATAGLVLGPVATAGAYAQGLISGFTYAQTFGFALASSLTFDFFMNDNKMLTQWLGGPLGRSLDKINRWRGTGETEADYVKRTAIATPQRFNETNEEYANRVKADNVMFGWTRNEHYQQFRERRDQTMKMYKHGWEKYFRDNVPKWSFSHAESIPYSYTLGTFFE